MKTFVGLVLAASWLLRSCVTDDTDLTDTRAPVFGCERAAAAVHSPRPPSRIRVGVTGVIAEAGQYLAEAEGHFAEQGLRVQFINFTAPSRMVPALAAGQLEVGSGSIGPGLLNASEGDMCVKIVGSLSREEVNANGVFLFARRELIDSGRLRDYPDLKSLHIAVPGRDNTSEYALAKLLSAGACR